MNTVVLQLRQPPVVRVDLRQVDVRTLALRPPTETATLRVRHGNEAVELGTFFRVDIRTDGAETAELRFEGDLSRFDRIGWKLSDAVRIVIDGNVGDYVGASMTGGDIVVDGNAGLFAGCGMAGGRLAVRGDVGDFAAAAFPGDMEGMRGGTLVVERNAGARFGDRMRRGTAVVAGDVGAFAGSRMVAGTIAIGGTAARHAGFGMRRGSIVLVDTATTPEATFVPVLADFGVVWQLLARDLQRFGGPFAQLASRRPQRYIGDLSANGKGDLLIAQ